MRLTLIDYRTHTEENISFGTCDLCMYTAIAEEQYFYFQDEAGAVHTVPGFEWDWGMLIDIEIDNIPHFAGWVSNQEFDCPDYTFEWLKETVDRYNLSLDTEQFSLWLDSCVSVEGDEIHLDFAEDKSVEGWMFKKLINDSCSKENPCLIDSITIENGDSSQQIELPANQNISAHSLSVRCIRNVLEISLPGQPKTRSKQWLRFDLPCHLSIKFKNKTTLSH